MEEVVLTQFVRNKLLDLVDILYEGEYFGFRADAEYYVDSIYDFMESIPKQQKFKTYDPIYG